MQDIVADNAIDLPTQIAGEWLQVGGHNEGFLYAACAQGKGIQLREDDFLRNPRGE